MTGIKRAFDENKDKELILCEKRVPAVFLGDENALVELLEDYKDCTAIIAFSDMIALEVCHALKIMKKRVPEDVSVLGFDKC